ncbi:hypothetical protein AO053_00275 [Haemophilus influenzae biotype aegyptius]|uniref:TraA-like protein n=1 Tax=Haemophilus influenzae biotype aegyptius TaxID=725 RepID=Q8VRD3_HAEIF|nr:type IV secretion system protein [Haemophilus influenzae]AAL47112.1 TraD/VirB6-like protein [Haemophilus influenzae biotype aegyptius]AAM64129.1 TraA-like protein [Haemophilus influenzae biotype aegyptius]TMQ40899.1 hypothetical protein AO053_00275 [Haemophilus influenzae biotype aegyptius]TMQ40997.1 hypothetical protein AO051_00115 [Haemophilus influenzae biotype aegyptius]TMQ41750.1 hypothetical protein AO052_00030 [Haemophilus influenzae biotype aegyptius]
MTDSSFIANIYTKVAKIFVENVDKYASNIAGQAKPVIIAAFLLYMLYVVYRMYSKKDALWEEFTNKIILFAIVGAFATTGEHYSNVISFVLNAGDEIAAKLSTNATGSISSVDNVYNAFQTDIDEIKMQWNDQGFWSKWTGANVDLLVALLFLYIAQFLFAVIIAVNLLIAKIMVVLLLSVGIIFISFSVFPATRNMFFSFLGLCFNYIFLNVLYSVAAKLASDYIQGTFNPSNLSTSVITSSFESLVTVAIIVLAINQIPTLVSSLTGGVGISAFTISSHSFGKMANLAKQALFGKKGGRKGLVNGAASGAKAAWNTWKNRGSGKASSAK